MNKISKLFLVLRYLSSSISPAPVIVFTNFQSYIQRNNLVHSQEIGEANE